MNVNVPASFLIFSSYFCGVFSVSEMDSGMVKVKEWNQSYYGHDSGIQSGATTIRDDDGDYKTTTRYVTTTTVTKEQPGETTQS